VPARRQAPRQPQGSRVPSRAAGQEPCSSGTPFVRLQCLCTAGLRLRAGRVKRPLLATHVVGTAGYLVPEGGRSGAAVRRVLAPRLHEADAVALVLEDPEVLPAAVLALVLGGGQSRCVTDHYVPVGDDLLIGERRSRAVGRRRSDTGPRTRSASNVSAPEPSGPPSTIVMSAEVEKPRLLVPKVPTAARLPETARQVTGPESCSKNKRSPMLTWLTWPDGFHPPDRS
jgi:hypothetical protein